MYKMTIEIDCQYYENYNTSNGVTSDGLPRWKAKGGHRLLFNIDSSIYDRLHFSGEFDIESVLNQLVRKRCNSMQMFEMLEWRLQDEQEWLDVDFDELLQSNTE